MSMTSSDSGWRSFIGPMAGLAALPIIQDNHPLREPGPGIGVVLWGLAIATALFAALFYLWKRSVKQTADSGRTAKPQPTAYDVARLHGATESKTGTERAPEPTSAGVRAPGIFISYRRSDSADITGRIDDRLRARFGAKNIFKDVDSIPLGVDFREYVDAQVSQCQVLLAIVGDAWLEPKESPRLNQERDLVRIELESALGRKIPVIPVLVGGADIPSEQDLPASLRSLVYRNAIQVRVDPDFHHDMDRLIAGLEQHLGMRAGSR